MNFAIRCFLYILIFWLPYSPAVVEVCVVAASILWLIKRSLFFFQTIRDNHRSANVFVASETESFQRVIKSARSAYFIVFIKSFRPIPTFLDVPILCFLAAALLSLCGSFYFEQSFHGFLTKTLEWFIVYFLVVEVFNHNKYFNIFLGVLFFTSLAVGVDAILQFYFLKKDIFLGRELARGGATAAFKHANLLGGYMATIIPVVLAAICAVPKVFVKVCLGCVLLILIWSLGITFSRGAWLGCLAGVLFFLYTLKRKIFVWGIFILILLICGAGILLSQQTKTLLRLTADNIHDTMSWRLGVWEDSVKMIKDKPAFGHGVNTYMMLFQEYRRKYMGYADYSPTYAHNCYIQLAAETGVFGLAAFLWIFLRLFKKVIAQTREIGQNTTSSIFSIGLLSAVLTFLAHSAVDTNFYSLQISILFWILTGLLSAHVLVLETERSSPRDA